MQLALFLASILITILAIRFERSGKSIKRIPFALIFIGLTLANLIVLYTRNLLQLEEVSIIMNLIIQFVFWQKSVQRARDAGLNKKDFWLLIIPFINLIFLGMLFFKKTAIGEQTSEKVPTNKEVKLKAKNSYLYNLFPLSQAELKKEKEKNNNITSEKPYSRLVRNKPVLSIFLMLTFLITSYWNYGSRITGSIRGSQRCSLEKPIEIRIQNYTFRRLIRTKFELELWKDGKAKDLSLYNKSTNYGGYVFSKITEPFSSSYGCYSDEYLTFPTESYKRNEKGTLSSLAWEQALWFTNTTEGLEVYIKNTSFEFAE